MRLNENPRIGLINRLICVAITVALVAAVIAVISCLI